jgi:hypothetical protein
MHESKLDEKYVSESKLDSTRQLGFLSAICHENVFSIAILCQITFFRKFICFQVPEFKLYKDNNQYNVAIKRTNNLIQIDADQYELLKKMHIFIYSNLLSIDFLQNFEDSLYGGFILLLKPSEKDSSFFE